MLKSVIGEIYYSLSSEELKQLDFYLSNNHWQYKETIFKCHECVKFYTEKNELDSLNKEILFQYIYGEEEYIDGKLRYVLNQLVDAVKEFILIYQKNQKNVFTEKVWIDFLLEKKLKKNIQYSLEKNQGKSQSEYRFLYEYFKSQELNSQTFLFSKDVKNQFNSIHQVMEKAEIFSDLVFIKNYCSLISFTNVFQSINSALPVNKFNEIKSKNWQEKYPEFKVYNGLIELLLNKNEPKFYFSYKQILFDNFSIWTDEEIDNFLVALLNYTSEQINKGNIDFIEEQFELFNFFEINNIYFTSKFITQGRINNAIYIYLRKREFERAEKFILTYHSLLPIEIRTSCLHFNTARIHFENKKYKESLRELLHVDFSHDTFYSINSKIILSKNYFELNESDAFDSLCISFNQFVRKNKVISESYKLSCLNFIKIIQKVYGASPTKLGKLKLKIEASSQLAEKNWLISKCEIIKKT